MLVLSVCLLRFVGVSVCQLVEVVLLTLSLQMIPYKLYFSKRKL